MEFNTAAALSRQTLESNVNNTIFAQYIKGDFVFQAGAPGKNIYLLIKGRIKLYRVSSEGKKVTQWFCFPGEVFGLAELPSKQRRTIYAQCCEDCEVSEIPLDQFKTLLSTSPDIALQVIEQLTMRLKIVGDTLLNFTADDSRSRLIKLLIRLNMRFGVELDSKRLIDVILTHNELADMIGACRQTVTSILGALKREGKINYINHRISFDSASVLEALIDQH